MNLGCLLFESKPVKVYHASPESGITKFQPRWSPAYQQMGLFVSQSRRAIINSWADWAIGHKGRGNRTEEQRYQNVTIYTLSVPAEAIEHAEELSKSDKRMYWDDELFILEQWLDSVEIVGSNTLTAHEVGDLQRRMSGFRRAARTITPEDLAAEVRKTNPAADLFLRLKSELSDLALAGKLTPLGNDTDGVLQKRKDELLAAQKKLEGMLETWENGQSVPTTKLTPGQQAEFDRLEPYVTQLLQQFSEPLYRS